MKKQREIPSKAEVKKMPNSVLEAIQTNSAEQEQFMRLQNERLARLRALSEASPQEQNACRKEVVKGLQEAGILNKSKKLAKEYR